MRRLFPILFCLMLLTAIASATVTLNVTAPTNGGTYGSPVLFTATATSSTNSSITAWKIYSDSAQVYSNSGGNNLSASIALANGTHSLAIQAWDATGALGKVTMSITVGAPQVTVSISNPANGTTVTSPFQLSATAIPSAGQTIVGWRVYIDSVDQTATDCTSGCGGSYTAQLSMATGTHQIVVRAWDSSGTYGSQTITATVAAPTGTGTVAGSVIDSSTGNTIGGVTVSWSGGSTTTSSPGNGVPSGHIFVVALEDNSYSNVVGNTNLPYLNQTLIPKGILLNNFYANQHGSLNNYMWLTGGSGQTTQCNADHCAATSPGTNPAANFVVNQDNIIRQINTAGKTWRGYFENMPSIGFLSTASPDGKYVEAHNPFPWYSDLNTTAQQNNMVPFTQFSTDLSGQSFANFNFIVPNTDDDKGDATTDNWLKTNLDPLLQSSYFQTGGDGILVIWFDEGSLSPLDSTNGGGHSTVIMLGPGLKTGITDATFGQHQNLLRMFMENMGIVDYPGASTSTTTDYSGDYLSQVGGGTYTLNNVSVGSQPITFTKTGYNTTTANASVQANATTQLDQSLSPTSSGTGTNYGPLGVYFLTGDVNQVHDPGFIHAGTKYYTFSTDVAYGDGLKIRCSTDHVNWSICGKVFSTTPSWIITKYPTFGQNGQGIWDPSPFYWNGTYYLYYVASIWGANNSSIGLATNSGTDLSTGWVDQGEVTSSTTSNDYNDLGPRITIDGSNYWLSYGSYMSGIHQRQIDPTTGKLLASNPTDYILASRPSVTPALDPSVFGEDFMTPAGRDAFPYPLKTIRLWDADGGVTQWKQIETSRGVYDWSKLDSWLSAAQSRGWDVIFTFGYTPDWATNSSCSSFSTAKWSCPPANNAYWTEFVTALMQHTGTKIKYFELWNEFQGRTGSQPYWTGSIYQMATLAQLAYPIIHNANPSAVVLSPSVAGDTTDAVLYAQCYLQTTGTSCSSSTLLNAGETTGAGGNAYADAVSFHGYLSGAAEGIKNLIQYYQGAMVDSRVNLTGKGLYDTESGFTSSNTTTTADKIAWEARDRLIEASMNLSKSIWYSWDNSQIGTQWSASAGVSTVGSAYYEVEKWIGGASFSAPCAASGTVWTCTLTRPGGYQALAVWNTAGNSSYTPNSQYVRYRDLAGLTYHMTPGQSITIGTQPFLLENQTGGGYVEGQTIWKNGNYWYMFDSFDLCCRGTNSTYKIMVGRSTNVNGPYVDQNGTPLIDGGGTFVLQGNSTWAGPGHPFIYHDTDGNDIVAFHAYSMVDGVPWLHLNNVTYVNGWPQISPCSPGAATCTGTGGGGAITPGSTTTLNAETTGNTSASTNWPSSTNGDLAGNTNISKVSVKKLLYSGSTTKVLMNELFWWTSTKIDMAANYRGHISIGYQSNDPTQVHSQLNDMYSRGFDGVVLDWYGRGNLGSNDLQYTENQATLQTIADINQYYGTRPMQYALMLDHIYTWTCGGSNWSSRGYSDITSCLSGEINKDLDYANSNIFNGSHAIKVSGHPLVLVFITENSSEFSGANWTTVWQTVYSHIASESNGAPYLLFQGKGGFTHNGGTDGGYTWVNNNESLGSSYATDEGTILLDQFYKYWQANYPSKQVVGGAWKGFNDSLATWGLNRLMYQKCGQTWIDTWNQTDLDFTYTSQLSFLQPSTWNDYEEGTELESGIDSCNGVTTSLSGSTLFITRTGNGFSDTVDHYTLYYSTDGQSLTVLQDNIAPSTASINLSNYVFPSSGNYSVYVKLVSKNSLSNAMSTPVTYSVAAIPPLAALSVTPTSGSVPLTVTADTSGSSSSSGIASRKIDWGDGFTSTPSGFSATHTYTNPGNYIVQAYIVSTNGAGANTSAYVTVNANASVNSASFASVLQNGSYVYSPVRVTGQVTAVNPPISDARIFVDGVIVYDVSNSTGIFNLDKYVFMSGGSWHTLMLEGVDSKGNKFDSPTISVYCIGHVN